MIPLLYFLLFLLLWGAVAFVLLGRGMGGAWSREGPAEIARRVKGRNRGILLGTLAVVVVAAVLEALIPAVSEAIQDLQYLVGDAMGSDPILVYETGGGTVSWGLYLAVLLGTLAGLAVGTTASKGRYPVLSGLSLRSFL